MSRSQSVLLLALAVALASVWAAPNPASGASAKSVFATVATSVVVVPALDGRDNVVAQGSGVVVDTNSVVTNGHVLEGAANVAVRQAMDAAAGEIWRMAALVPARDDERDLNFALPVEWVQQRPEQGRVEAVCAEHPDYACVLEMAWRNARGIEDASLRSLALENIAEAQAESGDIASALDVARGIEHARFRVSALLAIAKAQARAGNFVDAMNTAMGFKPTRVQRVEALAAIATQLAARR